MYNFGVNRVIEGFKKKYDWGLFFAVFALVIIGLAFLSSALPVKGNLFGEFFKQLLFGVWLGFFALLVLANLDYKKIFKYHRIIFAINFAMIFYLFIPFIFSKILYFVNPEISRIKIVEFLSFLPIYPVADPQNVAFRWLNVFDFVYIQPSETLKLTLLILFGYYVSKKIDFTYQNFKKPLWALFVSSFMVVAQPDLGTVVMIFAILLAGLFTTHLDKKKILTYIILPVLVFILLFVSLEGYRMTRVLVWISTSVCPENTNISYCQNLTNDRLTSSDSYQVDKIREAISSGGLWGVGYGKSELKNSVPELSTDGIIAVIGAEGGFVMVLLILSLYFYIFHRSLVIAKNTEDSGGKLLAVGIGVWILLQALWNITGMTGMVPMKGLPLPFISEGGTAMLINLAAIGILLNISTQTGQLSQKDLPKRKKMVKQSL